MTRAQVRIRAAWVTLTGTSAAASVVLAVLTIACVFVAMAGPRHSLGFRTTALQQTIDGQPLRARSVVADIPVDLLAVPGSADVPVSALQQAASVLSHNLARQPLPLKPASARWFGLATNADSAIGVAKRAYLTKPPQMALLYRNALIQHSRLLIGAYPNTVTLVKGVPVFQVAITPATAYRLGVHTGSEFGIGKVELRVSGIIRPAGPPSDLGAALLR